MKKIVYNKKNGLEVKLDKSDLCPISGRWLVPGSCTEVEPPRKKDGFALKFEKGEWSQVKTEEQVKDEEKERLEPEVQTLEARVEELRREIAILEGRVEELKKR